MVDVHAVSVRYLSMLTLMPQGNDYPYADAGECQIVKAGSSPAVPKKLWKDKDSQKKGTNKRLCESP